MNKNRKISVYGFVFGSGKRLIATVETDLESERVARQFKALTNAQKFEWVRNMAKAQGGVA